VWWWGCVYVLVGGVCVVVVFSVVCVVFVWLVVLREMCWSTGIYSERRFGKGKASSVQSSGTARQRPPTSNRSAVTPLAEAAWFGASSFHPCGLIVPAAETTCTQSKPGVHKAAIQRDAEGPSPGKYSVATITPRAGVWNRTGIVARMPRLPTPFADAAEPLRNALLAQNIRLCFPKTTITGAFHLTGASWSIDSSSATRPATEFDCNLDAMAGGQWARLRRQARFGCSPNLYRR